ncbi:MAG: hypothetical protein HGA61_03355 [Candidatus Moranbacteria bacterium]|nr:hypothetical protein [Candidatus Moranbacteria bacterium]
MNIIEKIKQNKKTVIIFLLILTAGILLRTYQFHNWMRFSVDQVRDAGIVSAALENKEPLPLLGPKAGTTTFKLGSIYYHFSYFSAKVFGNYPDKMAYPSLFSAILAIPLMYFLARKYFSKKVALSIMAVMSFSYLLVISSRFSSNPNVVPFFLLLYLYSMLELLDGQNKRSYFWSVLVGLALGVSVQLHTTLLVIMPLMTLGILGFLLKDKRVGVFKNFFIIFVVALFFNISQLNYEINNDWANSKIFLASLSSKSKTETSLFEKVYLVSTCQLQANSYMISSLIPDVEIKNNSDNATCNHIFQNPKGGLDKKLAYYSNIFASVLFSVFGYGLFYRRFKKERDKSKQSFLGLLLLFQFLAFVVFVPVAEMLHTGYFNILFPVPLVMFGLLVEFVLVKFKKKGKIIVLVLLTLLLLSSLAKSYQLALRYMDGKENNSRNVTLGEIERMSKYVLSNSAGNSKVYFSGQKDLVDRYYKTINYFAEEAGLDMTFLKSENIANGKAEIRKGVPIFYIQKNGHEKNDPGEIRQGREIVSSQIFSNQTMLILKN